MRIFVVAAIASIFAVACDDGGTSQQPTSDAGTAEPATTAPTPNPSPIGLAAGPRRIAFISDRDGPYYLFTMNSDGSDVRRLSDQPVGPPWFSVSRDGTQIAAMADEGGVEGRPLRLLRVDVAGGATSPIGEAPMYLEVLSPALDWRADDSAIPTLSDVVCYEFRSGGGPVHAANLEACRKAASLAEGPDGRWAAVVGDNLLVGKGTDDAGANRIDTVIPAGGNQREFARYAYGGLILFGRSRPLWSPDGTTIAYFDGDAASGQRGIAIIPAVGGPSRLLVASDGGMIPEAWSPDGRAIFYSDFEQEETIKVVDVATGQSRTVLGHDGHNYWSPRLVVEAPAPSRPSASSDSAARAE